MKLLLWGVTLFVAVLWTLLVALTASIVNWLAGSGAPVIGAAQQVAEWPLPPWASLWIDPAMVDGLRSMLTWSIDFVVNYAPWLFSALGWIAPVLWALWGLGMVVLLLLATVGQVLLGRLKPPTRSI